MNEDLSINDVALLKYNGFYRARVVENNIDENIYGAIRVFIRELIDLSLLDILDEKKYQIEDYVLQKYERGKDFLSFLKERYKDATPEDLEIPDTPIGIIAYPANTAMGGYASDLDETSAANYQNSVIIPSVGSLVWVFFEDGNITRPFYFNSFKFRTSFMPPENIDGDEPQRTYTLIKTYEGRSIIVSDSKDLARIEITGRRRNLDYFHNTQYLDIKYTDDTFFSYLKPSGSYEASYDIERNMTTILLDERDESERLLVKSHKGDFIEMDIKNRKLNIYMENDINIYTAGNLNVNVGRNFHVFCKGDGIYRFLGRSAFVSDKPFTVGSFSDLNLIAGEYYNSYSGTATFRQIDYAPLFIHSQSEDVRLRPKAVRDVVDDKDMRITSSLYEIDEREALTYYDKIKAALSSVQPSQEQGNK